MKQSSMNENGVDAASQILQNIDFESRYLVLQTHRYKIELN